MNCFSDLTHFDLTRMTLREITVLSETHGEDREFLSKLALDSRVGVQKLYTQLIARHEQATRELERLTAMTSYERDLWVQGVTLVAGIDEAGRGPLAGPVAAGAVILPPGCRIIGVNDSKQLSAKKREQLYEEICGKAVCWSVGLATVEEIDQLNILRATHLAMRRAISGLDQSPEHLLIDALTIPGLKTSQQGIVGGDGLSVSIAAASIMAKVTRDRLMEEVDRLYPEYGFAQHKGYGTKEHIAVIRARGLSPIHRKSFCGHFVSEVTTCWT